MTYPKITRYEISEEVFLFLSGDTWMLQCGEDLIPLTLEELDDLCITINEIRRT